MGGTDARPSDDEERIILGPDTPQAVVPKNTWQSARPASDEDVLVSCVVAPGFDFADFRLFEL
jgi:uncharacterized protein